jgi:hypothetical protein
VGPTLVVTSGLEDQEVGPKHVVGWGHDSSVKPSAPAAQGSASCALRDSRAHRTPATGPRARPIGNPISHAARRFAHAWAEPADSAAGARWRGRHWCSPRSAFSGPNRHPSPPSIGSQIRLFRPPLTAGTSEVGRAAGSLPFQHCGRMRCARGHAPGHRTIPQERIGVPERLRSLVKARPAVTSGCLHGCDCSSAFLEFADSGDTAIGGE